jgi:hypothetical protein
VSGSNVILIYEASPRPALETRVSHAFACVWMRLDAFGCVLMRFDAFGYVRIRSDTLGVGWLEFHIPFVAAPSLVLFIVARLT